MSVGISRARATMVWGGIALAILAPLIAAAQSPLLAWREPAYIAAGFAGAAGLALIFLQPLLAGGRLPGLSPQIARRAHRLSGALLVGAVLVHVIGLWVTSPPDVIDALLFASPTPFSIWGVIAMWTLFAAAFLAALRRVLRLRPRLWRMGHLALTTITVAGVVLHALLIEGAMEIATKWALCLLAVAALAKTAFEVKPWSQRRGGAR